MGVSNPVGRHHPRLREISEKLDSKDPFGAIGGFVYYPEDS
jgi:hypothetical protein